jgi:magnesium transporter
MALPRMGKNKKAAVPEMVEEAGRPKIASVTKGKLTWVNIEAPTKQETDYLAQTYSFNQLDLDDCLSRRQRPKIDEYEDYIFVVLHFPKWYKDVEIARPSQVAMFVGKNYVVTVHSGELTPLVKLFAACQEHEEARQMFMGRTSAFLAYRIIDLLVDYCFPIMDKILSKMEDVEDAVFDETSETARDVSVLRRDVIAQRRIIWPLRTVIAELETKLKRYTTRDLSHLFGDTLDHLNKIWDTLDECKEIIEVFKDSDQVLSSQRINVILRILTIITAIGTVLTMLTSFYGMNIPLPGGSNPGGWAYSWVVHLGASVVVGGAMYLFFRYKRWI